MAETAKGFLERWRESHIYAQSPALEELDSIVADCISDAKKAGLTEDALEKESGGLTAICARRSRMRTKATSSFFGGARGLGSTFAASRAQRRDSRQGDAGEPGDLPYPSMTTASGASGPGVARS